MGPETLAQVLCSLEQSKDENLLTRGEPYADAGVYRVLPEMALVQSVDFFTPVVDDPYQFGQIAAANSLSDIYAAGGKPLTALNLVGFPCNKLPLEVLKEILKGGQDKVEEAGAVIAGGHTVEDEEPKYGLSVTGVVHPEERLINSGAQPGDTLVLTKPLGTGVLSTALKGGVLEPEQAGQVIEGMSALNAGAARAAREVSVNACTDITGFGLLGHSGEMSEAGGVTLVLSVSRLPLYPWTQEMAEMGMFPGGACRNRDYMGEKVESRYDVEKYPLALDLVADPQTSGGLLLSVSPEKKPYLLQALERYGEKGYEIGKVERSFKGKVILVD